MVGVVASVLIFSLLLAIFAIWKVSQKRKTYVSRDYINVSSEQSKKDAYDFCLSRKSVRTYDEARDVPEDLQNKIRNFLGDDDKMTGPFKTRIYIDFVRMQASGKISSYGFIVGPNYFLLGHVNQVESNKNPLILVDFGYVFEKVIIYCTELGLSTVCLGGGNPKTFASQITLKPDEKILMNSPVGYSKSAPSTRETVIETVGGGRYRFPFSKLFFKGFNVETDGISKPEESGPLRKALEAVWWAPSGINLQPWRVFLDTTTPTEASVVHFFAAKGMFVHVNVGISIANFVLVAEESLGLKGVVQVLPTAEVPTILPSTAAGKLVYIGTWTPIGKGN